MLLINRLLSRFGRIQLRACSNRVSEAAVLYALSVHGTVGQWIPIFAQHVTFFEHETLLHPFGVKSVKEQVAGLRERGLVVRAYAEEITIGDRHSTIIKVDNMVDMTTLPEYPSTVRDMIYRNPLPVFFVQVQYAKLLEYTAPDLQGTIQAIIAEVARQHTVQVNHLFPEFVEAHLYNYLTKDGKEPFAVPSAIASYLSSLIHKEVLSFREKEAA